MLFSNATLKMCWWLRRLFPIFTEIMLRRAVPHSLRMERVCPTACFASRRWCVPTNETPIQVEWASADFYKRLGLDSSSRSNITTAEIRKQYKLLVKVYHPDMSNNSNASDTAFKNIKEAYETLSNEHKRTAYDSLGSERYQEAAEHWGAEVSPEDFARRQAMRQALAGGLPYFLASVALFVTIMIYHYRQRLVRSPAKPGADSPYTSVGTSAISSIALFGFLLVTITVFPRVLVAALMYLMHASDCLVIFEKEMQVNSTMICTISPPVGKPSKDGAQLHNVRFSVTGVDPQHVNQSYLVLEIEKGVAKEGAELERETLVFAPGVHTVTLPLRLSVTNEDFKYQAHVRIVNENLKLTLLDKVCEISL